MTTEEIDKAVKDYTELLKSIAFENLSGEETPYLLRGAFKEGLESANKHWQEKTKWKSLKTEPPKLPVVFKEPLLVIRGENSGRYAIKLLISQNSIDYWLKEGFTEWKEIESYEN